MSINPFLAGQQEYTLPLRSAAVSVFGDWLVAVIQWYREWLSGLMIRQPKKSVSVGVEPEDLEGVPNRQES